MKKLLPVMLLIAACIAFSPAPAYACSSNTDCGAGQYCSATGSCVSSFGTSCSSSADCSTGYSCDGGTCVSSSASSGGSSSGTLGNFLQGIITFFDQYLVPLIFAVAFIVFLWGIVQYFIIGATNEESQKKGRQLIIYGIIGFVLMVSIWGIIAMFKNTLGFDTTVRPSLPTFGTSK